MKIDDYTLGIIWSIGSCQEGRFVFRHRDKYFLGKLQSYCGNEIYKQTTQKGKLQYVLKTSSFSPEDFPGWSERNSDQRDIPVLDNYQDFLRSYMEIHSSIDYCTSYKRKPKIGKYKRLRLRIYGNYVAIMSINNILHEYCRVAKKSPQYSDNGKTTYIAFTKFEEIGNILDWVSGEPHNKIYWDDADYKLKNPILM